MGTFKVGLKAFLILIWLHTTCGQKVECDNFKSMHPKGVLLLGVVALLKWLWPYWMEEICHFVTGPGGVLCFGFSQWNGLLLAAMRVLMYQFLLQHHVCMHAVVFPTMMIKDLSSETKSSIQLNYFLKINLLWSFCLFTEIVFQTKLAIQTKSKMKCWPYLTM